MEEQKLLSKEDVILQSLYEFYNNNNIDKILPIITGKTKLSLRVLDWFVTNYSKKYNVVYNIKKNSENISFNVHQDYKNKLKSYNKRFFDPFCRKNKKNITNKIAFNYNIDKYVITTIGQLNFFRWAIRNNIIKYVLSNLDSINIDMNKGNLKKKKKSKLNNNKNITKPRTIQTILEIGK